jgi:mxaJ protein
MTGAVTARQERLVLLVPLATLLVVSALRSGVMNAFARPVANTTTLRVCADPNNMPFSNARGDGFENKIAQMVAHERGATVEYTWWAQRRGFVRNTLNAHECDLVVGTVAGMEMLTTTRPYYKSSYVFVSRRDRHLGIRSFDDSVLRRLKIGVQLVGDDFANTPPVHALAARGLRRNLVGFTLYGDYRTANPPARIIDAVANGAVDLAVAWGPMAGYFAARSRVPLDVVPVSPRIDLPFLPFVFDIAMGVRHGDSTFRHQLDDFIEHRQASIDSLLASYAVPRVDRAVSRGLARAPRASRRGS